MFKRPSLDINDTRTDRNRHGFLGNKIAKIILRLANRYTNFNRFRNRVLYVLNKYETYSEKILDVHKIRKTGTPKKEK